MITPWFQRLQEVLKEMGERKTLGKRKGRRNKAEDGEQNKYEIFLPNCGKLTVSRYSFLCFMVSPEYPGRHKLPTNLMVITCKLISTNSKEMTNNQISITLLKIKSHSFKGNHETHNSIKSRHDSSDRLPTICWWY